MTARLKSVPAPVGGWNARDPLPKMDEKDAVILDNWFPEAGKVTMRKGYESYSTGLGADVETLVEFSSASSNKMIAAANGNIWNATSSGAASSLGSGYSSDRWQTAMMNSYLGMVNGVDTPVKYDGTTLSTLTITGVSGSSLIGIHVHKSRSYFWPVNSASFWYSATNTLGGALTEFDLSLVGSTGGYLVFVESWSRDAGAGPDDYAVFVMSNGEVFIYSGSDPGDVNDWSLVGKFKMAKPIGIRSKIKVGGELVVGTYEGYIPLSAVMNKGDFSETNAVTDKIRQAVQQSANSYGTNFGWCASYYAEGNKVIFNVPVVESLTYQQHVYNSITGAWCRFTGIPSICWCVFNGALYFGGDSTVYKAETGYSDAGSNIQCDALPAFNSMGAMGRLKRFNSIQHIMGADGTLNVETKMGVNFIQPIFSYATTAYTQSGATWDVAEWDAEDWAGIGSDSVIDDWKTAFGIGYTGSARLRIATSNQEVSWYMTNYLFDIGGFV